MFFLTAKHSILKTVTIDANRWLAWVLTVWAGDGIGLERFVEDLHFPSFLIDRGNLFPPLIQLTTGQIDYTVTAVFVCLAIRTGKSIPFSQTLTVCSSDQSSWFIWM